MLVSHNLFFMHLLIYHYESNCIRVSILRQKAEPEAHIVFFHNGVSITTIWRTTAEKKKNGFCTEAKDKGSGYIKLVQASVFG